MKKRELSDSCWEYPLCRAESGIECNYCGLAARGS